MVLVEQTLLTLWTKLQRQLRRMIGPRQETINIFITANDEDAVISTVTNTASMHRTIGSTWAPAEKVSESAESSARAKNLAGVTSRTAHSQTEIRT